MDRQTESEIVTALLASSVWHSSRHPAIIHKAYREMRAGGFSPIPSAIMCLESYMSRDRAPLLRKSYREMEKLLGDEL